mmetsp:Transcript_69320/g.215205  ORF Transcript_69320/g.215205 Transcript_69320/m.215205 type:complete len:202 (-) Transcript_69320:551-1156(-)
MPATESMACLHEPAASSMASPRSLTSAKPSSKEKTPAAQRAVYSPSDRPAVTLKRRAASSRSLSLSAFIFSSPARPAMNIAGWQFLVCSSLSSGPLRHNSAMSKPRISFAFSSISLTAGMSLVVESIFTYCEPWPGKSRPMGSGFSAGALASAATTSSSSGSSGSARAPPYLAGSRPCFLAAPGRWRYQPLGGGLPHSMRL